MIYAILFLILAVASYSISQLAQHKKLRWQSSKEPFDFWGTMSWVRKYDSKAPNDIPAFFGSTTFLVFLTDGYHLMQAISFLCLSLSFYFLTSDWRIGVGSWAIIHLTHFIFYKILSK